MRSIEEYANNIEKSVDLKFTEIEPTCKYDKKKKIGIIFHGKKSIRVFKRKGKECIKLLNIQIDPIQRKIFFGFTVCNKDKKIIVHIVSYGGHDTALYKNYKLESLFFIKDKNYIIRDNDFDERVIPYEEFNIEDIVDNICNTVSKMYDEDTDLEEKNSLFEILKPALAVLLMETKDLWDRLITRNENEEKDNSFTK
jgi:hypothetical protein